jgi:two-component system NtrC family sensor kinase
MNQLQPMTLSTTPALQNPMSHRKVSRILIVEDDRINRHILESRLASHDYLTVSAESGSKALKALEKTDAAGKDEAASFDMVLLDVMMPGMDGIEVLKRVRERVSPIDLPIIMVTAKDQSGDIVAALNSGANDYVTKPIDFQVLLVRMATHLDLKATHDALRSSQLSLIHAAKLESVGYLAAGLAHEIRNPLAQIQMTVDALSRFAKTDAASDPAMQRRLLNGIEESVHRADEIVKGLLHYSDETRLQLVPCDLHRLITEVLSLLAGEVQQHSIDVHLQLCSEELEGLCAPEEMRQVLVNILLNAIQAMVNGGTLTISTRDTVADDLLHSVGSRSAAALRAGAAGALIEVLDTGSGVSETDLPRIYDPFYTSRPTGSGTGLGLTVARKLIELQGGIIEIQNRDDEHGLCVQMTLRQTPTQFV